MSKNYIIRQPDAIYPDMHKRLVLILLGANIALPRDFVNCSFSNEEFVLFSTNSLDFVTKLNQSYLGKYGLKAEVNETDKKFKTK